MTICGGPFPPDLLVHGHQFSKLMIERSVHYYSYMYYKHETEGGRVTTPSK